MRMLLRRLEVTDYGTFGHLVVDAGIFDCVTLERHDISIPAGVYNIELYGSPVHGLVPLLQDVPNREMIEIHAGDWEHDSKGCILVGSKRDGQAIDNSRATLLQLMGLLTKATDITLEIR